MSRLRAHIMVYSATFNHINAIASSRAHCFGSKISILLLITSFSITAVRPSLEAEAGVEYDDTTLPEAWTEFLLTSIPPAWHIANKALVQNVRSTEYLAGTDTLEHWSSMWTASASWGKPDGGLPTYLDTNFSKDEAECSTAVDRRQPRLTFEGNYRVGSGAFGCQVLKGHDYGLIVLYKVFEVRYGYLQLQRAWHITFPPGTQRSYDDFEGASEAIHILSLTHVCDRVDGKVTCSPLSQ